MSTAETDDIDDGGQAFPGILLDPTPGDRKLIFSLGMTLRDWFAGMAMQTLISPDVGDGYVAQEAYRHADAMLAERERRAG